MLDLNCDLGEGEPLARTRALMKWITSANVACGGHAGTIASMEACVRLAAEHGARIGAHPGAWSRTHFGRAPVAVTADELELLLVQQVGALERIARAHGARLHHLKLHGALYHAAEADEALARRYLRVTERWWPQCVIYARTDGLVARLDRRQSQKQGRRIRVWEEAFADRGYHDDGTLVPRGEPGAMLSTRRQILHRLQRLINDGVIETVSGRQLRFQPRTICVHSDTPRAVEWVSLAKQLLGPKSQCRGL